MRVCLLLIVVAACKGSTHITLDGSSDAPPGCHYDCTSEIQCRAGVAYQRTQASFPCAEWPGSCPGTAHVCSAGCDVEFGAHRFPQDWSTNLHAFCVETEAAQLGDRCDGGCVPTRAVADSQGVVHQQYLGCDAASNKCVAANAPQVASYLLPCVAGIDHAGPGITGIVREADGVCLLAWHAASASPRHGLSNFCIGDWECAEGASCDDSLPFVDLSGINAAVCRPGPRSAPLVDYLPP